MFPVREFHYNNFKVYLSVPDFSVATNSACNHLAYLSFSMSKCSILHDKKIMFLSANLQNLMSNFHLS